MMERFKERMDQEESDKAKAQELVDRMERKMATKKKWNVLDRESESLVREHFEDLQLEQDLDQNSKSG
jgi:hypothetical protein